MPEYTMDDLTDQRPEWDAVFPNEPPEHRVCDQGWAGTHRQGVHQDQEPEAPE